jgi:hypothetical protein
MASMEVMKTVSENVFISHGIVFFVRRTILKGFKAKQEVNKWNRERTRKRPRSRRIRDSTSSSIRSTTPKSLSPQNGANKPSQNEKTPR